MIDLNNFKDIANYTNYEPEQIVDTSSNMRRSERLAIMQPHTYSIGKGEMLGMCSCLHID